jgi:hypothetical protein
MGGGIGVKRVITWLCLTTLAAGIVVSFVTGA